LGAPWDQRTRTNPFARALTDERAEQDYAEHKRLTILQKWEFVFKVMGDLPPHRNRPQIGKPGRGIIFNPPIGMAICGTEFFTVAGARRLVCFMRG